MIDIQKAKIAFKDFLEQYEDKEHLSFKLKVVHTYHVTENDRKIAEKLSLNNEDIKLAELIGLLHDVGRFEELKITNELNSVKFDHALHGSKMLFEQGMIRNFIEDSQYDEIIKKAIENHSKLEIEEDLDERTLLHSKIIRDADKIDILYILTYADKKEEWEKEDLSLEKISDKIYTSFMEKNEVIYNQRKTPLDVLVSEFAYIFDFNYKYSLIYIKKEQYIETLYKRFCFKDEETKFRFNNIYEKTKSYIDTVIN